MQKSPTMCLHGRRTGVSVGCCPSPVPEGSSKVPLQIMHSLSSGAMSDGRTLGRLNMNRILGGRGGSPCTSAYISAARSVVFGLRKLGVRVLRELCSSLYMEPRSNCSFGATGDSSAKDMIF